MGLLARSIESFRSVAAASETDPLLRASNRLVAFFPVFSAVGYICDVQYGRYLERRTKRIARASACSARLKLKAGFGREEAEKDEFQIKLLKALAENLQIPETRLAIQGLSEGRGSVKLTVSLTRPKEDETGRPCIELWQKLKSDLKKVGETDALSSIDSIVVDGEADEKSKVYSVWITPSGKSAEICRKAIIDLQSKFPESPSIPSPHVPLLQISGEEQEVLGLVERVARETAPFTLDLSRQRLASRTSLACTSQRGVPRPSPPPSTPSRRSCPRGHGRNGWAAAAVGGERRARAE